MDSLDLAEPTGRVLVVCTGNVCRSPFLEGMLRLHMPPAIEVASAGTAAPVGEPVDPRVSEALSKHGASLPQFAARQLMPELVRDAHLILTATRAHRAAVVSLHPRALSYTFAFGDFSALAPQVVLDRLGETASPVEALRQRTELAARQRGLVAPRPAGEVDIVDPYRRENPVFAAMVTQVLDALPAVVRLLAPSGGVGGRPLPG